MDLVGALLASMIAGAVVIALAVCLAYPAFWVWMLVDSILREPWEYPNGTPNTKLAWVLVIAIVQPAAFVYLALVFARVKRGTVPKPAEWSQPPPPARTATPSAA